MDKDKSFWSHDTWTDDREDLDYNFEDEEDVVDSDFDDPEEAEDTGPAAEDTKRGSRSRKKGAQRGGYVDPVERARARAARAARKSAANRKPRRAPVAARQRVFRASTAAKAAASNATRKLKSEKSRIMAAKRRANMKTEQVLTQADLLQRAARVEVENRRSLEIMLQLEQDKKKVAAPKARARGPRIHIRRSLRNPETVTFLGYDSIPSVINSTAPEPPKPVRCAITGLPAKYRDPKTGKPYATLEAFRQIRAQLAATAAPGM